MVRVMRRIGSVASAGPLAIVRCLAVRAPAGGVGLRFAGTRG